MSNAGRRVFVLGLGGTIAMTATRRDGAAPTLSAADLLTAIPALTNLHLDLHAEDFRNLPGASLTFEDLAALSRRVSDLLDSGADGVVVTQGTDTIEESAYFLDLLHDQPQPVVVTGALRNPSLAGADGPANLLAAIQVAADPTARNLGCLVVMADQVHAARRVRKTHATSLTAFASPNGGPLGDVVEGRPRFVSHLTNRPHIPPGATSVDRAPCVPLVVVTLGDDGRMLEAVAQHADGLVLAGFGAGHVPEWLVDRLAALATGIPVVLASRTGAGSVLASTYGFVGSESNLLSSGLISAGNLDPVKARVLLYMLLAAGCDRTTAADAFAVAGGDATQQTWPWPTRMAQRKDTLDA